MPKNPVQIGELTCGHGNPLMLIAGPCVIESRDLTFRIAETLVEICRQQNVPLIFKASFDKANRTSLNSYRGMGIDAGLQILTDVHDTFAMPVTTDIHLPEQAYPASQAVQMLQIPAFLARQTDLLTAAAETELPVNVKKGQFMAPVDMQHVVGKLEAAGCDQVLLTERGTFFGYGSLVNDMTSIPRMQTLGVPVVFDATHSVQRPSAEGGKTGGDRSMVQPLARAAVAVGCDAIFVETHPDPKRSPSDGQNMIPLDELSAALKQLVSIRNSLADNDP